MKDPGLIYTSQHSFTKKERIALSALPPAVALCLKSLGIANRMEVRNGRFREEVADAHQVFLIGFWHEVLGLATWHYRNTGYHTLTSYSFDGELAARVVKHCGLRALRGSSSRGGTQALDQLQKALELGKTVGLALDGPRGPRRVAKPGIAILSARTGTPILPNAFGATRGWRLNSWDKMLIPKPLGRIICMYGAPIPPPQDRSNTAIEATRLEVEHSVKSLHEELDSELCAG